MIEYIRLPLSRKKWLYQHPEASKKLLSMVARVCVGYYVNQIQTISAPR